MKAVREGRLDAGLGAAVPPRDDEPGGGDDGPAPADERRAGFRSCHLGDGISEKNRQLRRQFAIEMAAPSCIEQLQPLGNRIRFWGGVIIRSEIRVVLGLDFRMVALSPLGG